MMRRWWVGAGVFWLGAMAIPAEAQTRYRLTFPERAQHFIQVEARFATAGAADLDVFLPVWMPGDYEIRNFSGRVERLGAVGADGRTLEVQALSKSRWRVSCAGQTEVRLAYRVRGVSRPRPASNYVDASRAVVQGAATFISPVRPLDPGFGLDVELPAGWTSVETGLPRVAGTSQGHYTARDFDQLVDCPLVAGSLTTEEFQVAGVRHHLIYLGAPGAKWKRARAQRDVTKLVVATHRMWSFFPFPQGYWFLNLPGSPGGGLEHGNSTCIEYNPSGRDSYRKWLQVVCHEYFHAWNVKYLHPLALGPFNYEARNDTPSLWVAEGLTHYYEGLLLARSGLFSPGDYLRTLSQHIKIHERHSVSLSEASLRTWDPGSRLASYRSGGVAVGFLLDQKIRQATEGQASLDEVMRRASRLYSGERGYSEEQFEAVASEVAGEELSEFFRRSVRSTEALDLAPALSFYGLRFPSGLNWMLEVDPKAGPEARAHWRAYLQGEPELSTSIGETIHRIAKI